MLKNYIVAVADFDNHDIKMFQTYADDDLQAVRYILENVFGDSVYECDMEDLDHLCSDINMIFTVEESE